LAVTSFLIPPGWIITGLHLHSINSNSIAPRSPLSHPILIMLSFLALIHQTISYSTYNLSKIVIFLKGRASLALTAGPGAPRSQPSFHSWIMCSSVDYKRFHITQTLNKAILCPLRKKTKTMPL
jgi:hypothetical protein